MTSELKTNIKPELTIERDFAYPPKTVFEAWLIPEQLVQWMGPIDEIKVSNVSINAVEGGQYHMQFNDPDCSENKLNGVYKVIDRYKKLVFTWVWEAPADGANEETLVTLDFIPIKGGTRLRLHHEKFSSNELRDRHDWGWNGTLDKLLRYIEEAG